MISKWIVSGIDFILLIIAIVYLVVERSYFARYSDELFVVVLISCILIANLFALLMVDFSKNSWIRLYFKRKALEEEQKIKNLINR